MGGKELKKINSSGQMTSVGKVKSPQSTKLQALPLGNCCSAGSPWRILQIHLYLTSRKCTQLRWWHTHDVVRITPCACWCCAVYTKF